MTVEEISTVCFVGAGTMGCYNSIVAAVSGYEVVLFDVDVDSLEQVPARHSEIAGLLVTNGWCTADDIALALQRVTLKSDLEQAVANADLVSESIFERLDIKREIHQKLDQVCPPRTLLTTNSSALLVSDIEDAVARGDRFAAMHSHLGAPLVDIVGGPRTSAGTIELLQRYVLSIGGVPLVLKKEHPGYVLNAMLGAVLTTGMLLVSQGAASVENVDRAWMRYRGAAMGPFALMDQFGLNLVHDSWQYREEDAATADLRARILELLQPLVDGNKLGAKSGAGFYHYPQPRYQQPGFVEEGVDLEPIYEALVTALIANAIVIASLEVADPAAIDRAWMTGTFLDTGPFAILAEIGNAEYLEVLEQQLAAGRMDPAKAQIVASYLRQYTPGSSN